MAARRYSPTRAGSWSSGRSRAGSGSFRYPGASSLIPALTVSGFSLDQFLYYGWLSPKKDRRQAELRQLRGERRTIVLMETPYRLVTLLRDLAAAFNQRRICIAFNLTIPDEQVFHGTAAELYRELSTGTQGRVRRRHRRQRNSDRTGPENSGRISLYGKV